MASSSAGGGDIADLTTTLDFTFALLDDTTVWRQRLVEEFTLGSSWHARVASSFQLEFPEELLEPYLEHQRHEWVRALVPLTTRPKRPLLGFGIEGPDDAPAHLLLRVSIAAIQAEYLRRLMLGHPARHHLESALPHTLLEAISAFPPAVYAEFDRDGLGRPPEVARYLKEGLGLHVTAEQAQRWLERQERSAAVLVAALNESPDVLSSSENVLLALPWMEPAPASVGDIEEIVDSYATGIEDASAADEGGLLVALAEYGRRWEVIVETELSLRRPSTVTLVEDRPLGLGRGRTVQRMALGDARSVHAHFHVSDHAVEIMGFDVADLQGRPVRVPYFQGVRHTPEALALYSGDPDRPYYVDVEVSLRPATDLRVVSAALEGLILLAAAVGTTVRGADLNAALGLLTVPTTFSVALLLVRERSSLASRLQRFSRLRLLLEVGALWVVVFTRLAW